MNDKELLFKEFLEFLNEDIVLKIEKNDDLTTPVYANYGDAGMDIRAAEDLYINPGDTKLISTNLKLSIPKGFQIEIRPRSGLSLNTPLVITNSPATIDSGYRDEIKVIIKNTSSEGDKIFSLGDKGNKKGIYHIKKGDRIAQIVLTKYYNIKFEYVENIKDDKTDRGGGFGSSGIN